MKNLNSAKFNKELSMSKIFLLQIGDSPYHWYAESATPRIVDRGESFFKYECLHEFEAKIGTARIVV